METREFGSPLPPTCPKPCRECPWLVDSLPGWLGPMEPESWVSLAHTDSPIACHETIKEVDADGNGSWDHPKMRQCAGAAIFRSNVHKSPRDPEVATLPADRTKVFATNKDFVDHHDPARTTQGQHFADLRHGDAPKQYLLTCLECGTERDTDDPSDDSCQTCLDEGRDDGCTETSWIKPCPLANDPSMICPSEHHHHGSGNHHIPVER